MSDGAFAISNTSSSLTPEQAGAALVDMKMKFDAANAATGPAASARAELQTKLNDPSFYSKFANGSSEARAEFERLLENGRADLTARIIAGDETAIPEAELRENGMSISDRMSGAKSLLENGLTVDQVRGLLDNTPLSRSDYEEVLRFERQKRGDPEFQKRFLRGDAEEVRLVNLISSYKVRGYKD